MFSCLLSVRTLEIISFVGGVSSSSACTLLAFSNDNAITPLVINKVFLFIYLYSPLFNNKHLYYFNESNLIVQSLSKPIKNVFLHICYYKFYFLIFYTLC